MKEKVQEYDILRVFAILLVVAGHSDFLSSYDFDVSYIISTELQTFKFSYEIIRPWIYSFHMQLFMMLSGAVFYLSNRNYCHKKYVYKRTKRLMVPFFLVGFIFDIPAKWMSGYFGTKSLLYGYIKSLVVMLTPGHLWFLWVLYVINIVFYILCKKINFIRNIGGGGYTFAFLLLINILSDKCPVYFQIYRLWKYPFYFYIGFLFEACGMRTKIVDKWNLKKKYTIVIVLALLSIFNIFIPTIDIWILDKIIEIIVALIGCLQIFVFSCCLTKEKITNYRLYNCLKKYNFSIYLFHEPLQFIILRMLVLTGMLKFFNSNIGYIFLWIFRFSLSVCISVLIGKIIKKIMRGWSRIKE